MVIESALLFILAWLWWYFVVVVLEGADVNVKAFLGGVMCGSCLVIFVAVLC